VPKPAAPEKKPPDVVAKVQPPKQPPPPVEPKAEVPETPKPPAAAAAPEKPSLKVAKPKEEGVKRYSLQVASLVVEQNALTLKKRLEKLGYTPIIRKVATSITRHRVYAGEFDGRQEAEEAARRLNVDGFPSNIVEGEAGKVRLEVGSAVQLNDAIDLAHNLQKKNHTAKIVSEPTSTLVHQVSVGQYGSRTEAQEALEALKKHGFAPLVVRR
jgi:cell division protein FtsN